MFWVDILHLARTFIQRQNYRNQKARLVCLETFPVLWDLMDLMGFVFVLVAGAVYAEFYSLHGASISCAEVSGPQAWGSLQWDLFNSSVVALCGS